MSLLLPARVKDEEAPGASSDFLSKQIPVDGIDSPELPFAYVPGAEMFQEEMVTGRRFGSVSGLSAEHVRKAVNMTLQAAVLALHGKDNEHYTQGPARWEGIQKGLKAWRGQYPHWSDCSAFATWCLWNGLDHFHHSDTVNGQRWQAGYTGTLLQHGRAVRSPIPGDLIIYGNGWPGEHTAVYTGGGLVVSHGGDPGPQLLRWNYRSDIISVRRYI
jgi:hypothetical protein